MCDKAMYRDPQRARSVEELHKEAIRLMKEKHRDMGLLEDTVR